MRVSIGYGAGVLEWLIKVLELEEDDTIMIHIGQFIAIFPSQVVRSWLLLHFG
jgi:hypothetical protein